MAARYVIDTNDLWEKLGSSTRSGASIKVALSGALSWQPKASGPPDASI
jgi:hypothetical protein